MKRLMLIESTLRFPGLLRGKATWYGQESNLGDVSRGWTVLSVEIGQAINATP